MTAPLGFFDPELVGDAWFDPELVASREGWFSQDFVDESGSSFTGSGTAALSSFAASGAGLLTFIGSGAASTQSFEAAGAGSETFTGTGAASTTPFAADGTGEEAFSGSGDAALQPFACSGAGAETFTGTGEAACSPFEASGTGEETLTGAGAAALSPFDASGTGSETFTGSGTAEGSPFGASGAGSEELIGAGSAALQPFESDGAGAEGFAGEGTAAAAPFDATGAGAETFDGAGEASTASFSSAGTGYAEPAPQPYRHLPAAPRQTNLGGGGGFVVNLELLPSLPGPERVHVHEHFEDVVTVVEAPAEPLEIKETAPLAVPASAAPEIEWIDVPGQAPEVHLHFHKHYGDQVTVIQQATPAAPMTVPTVDVDALVQAFEPTAEVVQAAPTRRGWGGMLFGAGVAALVVAIAWNAHMADPAPRPRKKRKKRRKR